jgi:hypothetical protein
MPAIARPPLPPQNSGMSKTTQTDQPTEMSYPQSGHCLCGRIHYRLLGPPRWSGYCHCESCRRATGAVGVAYGGFPDALVEITGQPAEFTSSPGVVRSFCPTCGTPISYRSTRWPGETHILVASMDNPAACPPAHHYHVDEEIEWVRFADGLPRHGPSEN